jgi:hypothetical protein
LRKFDDKSSSAVLNILRPNCPVMTFNDLLHNGETEACALISRGYERFKEPLLKLGRDARTVILNHQLKRVCPTLRSNGNKGMWGSYTLKGL